MREAAPFSSLSGGDPAGPVPGRGLAFDTPECLVRPERIPDYGDRSAVLCSPLEVAQRILPLQLAFHAPFNGPVTGTYRKCETTRSDRLVSSSPLRGRGGVSPAPIRGSLSGRISGCTAVPRDHPDFIESPSESALLFSFWLPFPAAWPVAGRDNVRLVRCLLTARSGQLPSGFERWVNRTYVPLVVGIGAGVKGAISNSMRTGVLLA